MKISTKISACLLAFMTGFLSLGQEILWVRLFGFTNHSIPQAFAFVLIYYLLGIAAGAHIGKELCRKTFNLWRVSGITLIAAAFFDVMSVWIYVEFAHSSWQQAIGGTLIFLTALFKAIIFPIAHHLAAPAESTNLGRAISRVYVSNIIGATAGPILMGFILLDYFTTQQCYAMTAAATFLTGLYCLERAHLKRVSNILTVTMCISMVALVSLIMKMEPSLLILNAAYNKAGIVSDIVETRQGIILVYKTEYNGADLVYGGNVYDGMTNLDPVINSNGIDRIIMLSVLQKKTKRVLFIGLSIGTWLKIATSFPGVEHIDVVEINPGYLKAMKPYPEQQSALADPRVHLYIDDGRRWLNLHPENKYDLIVINTTYHWRAYSTNLLSKEFLTLAKQHMLTGGLIAFNTTSSPDVLKTATNVFQHAYLYKNFVIAADFDWRENMKAPDAIATISALNYHGKPLFPKHSDALITRWLQTRIVSLQEVEEKIGRPAEVVTDINLLTEYKYATFGNTISRRPH